MPDDHRVLSHVSLRVPSDLIEAFDQLAVALGEAGRTGRTLLASFTGAPPTAPLDRVTLPPFGAWIAIVD